MTLNLPEYTYDLTTLKMFCNDDSEEMKKFLVNYLQSAGEDLKALMQAVADGKIETVQEKAHKMKSILALIQAEPHTSIANILMDTEAKPETENVRTLAGEFHRNVTRLFDELRTTYCQ